jgi:hypothetical protein
MVRFWHFRRRGSMSGSEPFLDINASAAYVAEWPKADICPKADISRFSFRQWRGQSSGASSLRTRILARCYAASRERFSELGLAWPHRCALSPSFRKIHACGTFWSHRLIKHLPVAVEVLLSLIGNVRAGAGKAPLDLRMRSTPKRPASPYFRLDGERSRETGRTRRPGHVMFSAERQHLSNF